MNLIPTLRHRPKSNYINLCLLHLICPKCYITYEVVIRNRKYNLEYFLDGLFAEGNLGYANLKNHKQKEKKAFLGLSV